MAETKGLFGDTYIREDKAVAIPIERYDELIKKECFYDELTRSHDALVVLRERLEVKKEEK